MNSIKSLIISLFGSYVPNTYVNADSVSVIPDGLSGVDIVWLSGFILFSITLVCVFKIIGGLLTKC